MSPRLDLLDVNVWLALSLEDHPHHAKAQDYWHNHSAEQMAFCRQTSLSLVRLLMQPAVTAGNPFSVAEAWQVYRTFRQLPDIVFLSEPAGCEAQLESWARSKNARSPLWTDAYLAAFAEAASTRMVSFDSDFSKFPKLRFLKL